MARKLDSGRPDSDGRTGETDDRDGESGGPTPLLGRRAYVKMGVAAVAATAGLTTTATAESGPVTRSGIEFDRALDAVEDLDMDPSGSTSIVPQLRSLEPDTLVRFPDGTFLLDERVEMELAGTLGLEAAGDAVLVADGDREVGIELATDGSIYYRGFTHDGTGGAVRHRWRADEAMEVRDVAVRVDGSTTTDAVSTASEFETIVLDPGEQRVYEMSDGEAFENVLIDQRAEGAMFVITMESGASDWVIRNVGWKGLAPTGSTRTRTFLVNVAGDGLVENIFIDQRNHDGGTGSDVGGIWTYSDRHHGHIECRHNFIAGVGNNACYDAGDGWAHMEATGTVGHEYCYHRDNTPSNFRPGKTDSHVRNSVSIANDPTGKRGGYPANGSQLTRACWAWHNPDIRMENCAIWWDPEDVSPSTPFWASIRDRSESTNCSLRVVDSDINASWDDSLAYGGGDVIFENLGNDPSIDVLGEGVPLTPEMAARGERALPPEVGTAPGGGHGESAGTEPEPAPAPSDEWSYESATGVHTDLPYELVIEHTDPGERVTYEVEFGGSVEVGEWEYNANIDGRVATGGVGPETGLDNIYFDGGIVRFDVTGADHARCLLADAQDREVLRELDPADFPEETRDTEDPLSYDDAEGVHTDLPREFVIELAETGERASYELEVDGHLEAGEFGGAPSIDGGVARGGVGPDEDIDNVYFDGEIAGFSGEHLDRARVFIAEAQTRRILAEFDPTQFPENVNTFTYAFAHGTHTDLSDELVIELTNPGERVTYEIEADGQVEAGEFAYPPTVEGAVATGGLGPARGLDNLYLDGEITRIAGEHLDRVRVYRADPVTRSIEAELDPADFAASPADEHVLRLEPGGDGGSYDITVSEDIRDDPDVAFDATGNISGRNAEGTVSDRTHGYLFEGELADVTLNGDVGLRVDGTPVEQDAGGETAVMIDGSAGEDVARYRFEVSESVEFAEDLSSGASGFWDLPRDHVDDGTVVGIVHERADAYRFSGEIVSLQVHGAADVEFLRD